MTTTPDIAAPAPASVATDAAGEHGFSLTIDVERDYLQTVTFDVADFPVMAMDEPAPLGDNAAPNPVRILGAAVGGCLGASLLFCMRKSRVDVQGLHTSVHGTMARNERGRLRVSALRVHLEPVVPAEQHDRVPRCLSLFEDFCTVTASIRGAIPVEVTVEPRAP
jgi:uncharacterized OsmC-like protein